MIDLAGYFPRVWQTAEGWKANCPKCGDDERKFHWNTEKQVGCCFHSRCAWFYQHGGITLSRAQAFFTTSGLALQIPDIVEDDEETEAEVKLPEEFKLIGEYPENLSSTLYSYLESRGVKKSLVEAAKIGYCDKGRWWGYLVFPVFNDEGKVVYHQKRRFKDREPKFHNPKSSKKSELIYRINPCTRPSRIIIVESIINALTIEDLKNEKQLVIAILGKSLSEIQRQLIMRFEKRMDEIVVALDGDARRDAVEIADDFTRRGEYVRIAPIPDGEDINSLGRKRAMDRILKAEFYQRSKRMEILKRHIAYA